MKQVALVFTSLAIGGLALRRNRSTEEVRTVSSNSSSQLPVDYGDLTCMMWTGGTCGMSSCMTTRGPVQCVESKCVCIPGHCANAEGFCTPGYTGKWIGSYSIRFVNAHDPTTPYLGVVSEHYDGLFGSGDKDIISAVADSSPQWKIAETPSGFVRFESIQSPGRVLTIYDSRRRSFLQTGERSDDVVAKNGTQAAKAKLSEDADLWPRLQKLEDTKPVGASFQARELTGGLEIWDPEREVSLSSTPKDGWFQDDIADHGVGECHPPGVLAEGCENRELLKFEPQLPGSAMSRGERRQVISAGGLHWWQSILIILGVIACVYAYFYFGIHRW